MTTEVFTSTTINPGDKKPGPLTRRVERVKRVADFIATVGRKDGISTIRELIKDHNAGNIRTVTAANLNKPFFYDLCL